MRNTEPGWYQVVIDPDDQNYQALMAAAREAVDHDDPNMTPALALKFEIGRRLHPLVHHYVPMKTWDEASRQLIATPYLTCLWCPKTKEE